MTMSSNMRSYARTTLSVAALAATLSMSFGADLASAQQIWFAPQDDLAHGANGDLYLNRDFTHLFDSKPAWDPNIDVFKISPKMGSAVGPAEELSRINAFLKERRIALAVSIAAFLLDNPNPVAGECGFGIEGSNRVGRNASDFRRLKQLGIEVRYLAMDEPLTFEHYYSKKNACHYSIDEVARRVAAAIAEIKQSYPDVRVVDEEAPSITTAVQWNADFPQWLEAYRRASGRPLDAVVFDVDWRQPWQSWVAPSVTAAHKAGVRAGMFLTGTGPGISDADAIAARKQNALAVEQARLPFDLVDIANWTPHPSRNLPESDPDTLTSFLYWYESRHGVRR